MTTPTTPLVWDRPDYLGAIYLHRPGHAAPAATLHVEIGPRGFVHYVAVNGRGQESTFVLTPRDRKHSTAVMEDAAPERLDALRRRLLADRWVNVVARG